MAEVINPSPTAEKMLSILCSMFCLNIKKIETTTELVSLGISEKDKEKLMNKLAEAFLIKLEPNKPINLHGEGNKLFADKWSVQINKIKTVWNLLQFVEGNDDYLGRPAANNI